MTEKEYKIITDNLGEYSVLRYDGSIVSTEIKNKAEAELFCDELNELNDENKELRQDNDIKYWKLQCLQSLNNNQMMLFELSRAIQQGYEVSDKFKQYLDEIKEHDKEIREKHKRLFE